MVEGILMDRSAKRTGLNPDVHAYCFVKVGKQTCPVKLAQLRSDSNGTAVMKQPMLNYQLCSTIKEVARRELMVTTAVF